MEAPGGGVDADGAPLRVAGHVNTTPAPVGRGGRARMTVVTSKEDGVSGRAGAAPRVAATEAKARLGGATLTKARAGMAGRPGSEGGGVGGRGGSNKPAAGAAAGAAGGAGRGATSTATRADRMFAKKGPLGSALGAWRGHCEAKRALWRVRVAAVARLCHSRRARAWRAWTSVTSAGLASRMERKRRTLSWGFDAWANAAEDAINERDALYHRAEALGRASLRAWRGAAEMSMLAEEGALELRARVDSELCALCLAGWLDAAQDAADAVFGAEVVRARGCVALLRRGYDAMARAAARGQVKAAMSRVCSAATAKRQEAAVSKALAEWRGRVLELACKMGKVEEALAAARGGRLLECMWARHEEGEEEEEGARIRIADVHSLKRAARSAWAWWCTSLSERRFYKDAAARAVSRRTARNARVYFCSWVLLHAASLRDAIEAGRASAHRRLSVLGKALITWRLSARTCAARGYKVDAADYHFAMKLQSVCFAVMRDAARRSRCLIEGGRKAVRRRCRNLLGLGMTAMKQYLEWRRGKKLWWLDLASTHAKWQRLSALSRLSSYVSHKRIVRAMKADGAIFFMKRMRRLGFWGWVLGTAESQRIQDEVTEADAHARALALSRSLKAIKGHAVNRVLRRDAKDARAAEARAHVESGTCRRCMSGWVEVHGGLIVKRMRRAMARGKRSEALTKGAWRAWRFGVERTLCLEAAHRAVEARHSAAVKQGAIQCWVYASRSETYIRSREDAVRRAYEGGIAYWAVGVWSRYVSKRAEKLSLEKEALSDRRQYLVKLAAAKWLKQGTDSIAARERMQEEERRRHDSKVQACVSRCARKWLSLTLSRRAARMANSPGGGDAASRATAYPRPLREDACDAYPRYREYAHSLPAAYPRKPDGRDAGSISGGGRPAPRRPPLSFDFGSGGAGQEDVGVVLKVSAGEGASRPRPYKYASTAEDWEVTRTALDVGRDAARSRASPTRLAAASTAKTGSMSPPSASISASPSSPSSSFSPSHSACDQDKALISHESASRRIGMTSQNQGNATAGDETDNRGDELSGMATFIRGSDNTRDGDECDEAACSKATPPWANRKGSDSSFAYDLRTDSRRPPRGTPPRCESFLGGDAESSCHAGGGVARLGFGECSAATPSRPQHADQVLGFSPGFGPQSAQIGGCGLLDSNLTPVKCTGASPATAPSHREREEGVPLTQSDGVALTPGVHQGGRQQPPQPQPQQQQQRQQPDETREVAGNRTGGGDRLEIGGAGHTSPGPPSGGSAASRKDEIVSKDGGELDVMERIVDSFKKAKCEYDEIVKVLEEGGMGGRWGSGGGARGAALRRKCDAWEGEREERKADVIKVAKRISELRATGR